MHEIKRHVRAAIIICTHLVLQELAEDVLDLLGLGRGQQRRGLLAELREECVLVSHLLRTTPII